MRADAHVRFGGRVGERNACKGVKRAQARPDSSTESTTAFSGGSRYSPTTSVALATSLGSVENLGVSRRHGCGPHRFHAVATV